jgi:hypothetical protein
MLQMALSGDRSTGPHYRSVGIQIMASRLAVRLILVLVATLAAGCASLLPKSKSETEAPWKTFEESKRTFDSIEPGQTTLEELKQLGYDPYVNPNVTVLNYSDVLSKYAPNAVRDEYLEPGIRECLQTQNKCSAYLLDHRQIRRDRVGNFFLDFINFKRRTEITGWRFGAVIVVVGDRVVHKSWSGVPAIKEVEENLNPLGPLQDNGPSLVPISLLPH